MRKTKLIAGLLLISGIVAGCSCDNSKVDTFANVSNGSNIVANSKGNKYTISDIYEGILNNNDEVAKTILLKIMKDKINLEDADMKALYTKYLNEYFDSTFYNNSTYMYLGEFDEEKVVKYLNSESYAVNCGEGYNSGVLDSGKYTCDYTDYIKREVEYNIYLKILKVKYLLNERSELINKNQGRRITYYEIAKGSEDNKVRTELEEYVASFEKNHASEDETLIRNIIDVAEAARKKDLQEITEQYAQVSTSKDSSNGYTYLNKFTTCGDKRCSLEEGKEYQDQQIMDKEYYYTKVVIKGNEDVLYETARNQLFSENVSNYLYTIGDKKYLMSPEYLDSKDKRINDIIMYDTTNSKYYLATVEVINSDSAFADKVLVAELLIDKISDETIFEYCFKDQDIKMYDKEIKEYFETKYGELEK